MEKVKRESTSSRSYGQFCAFARALDVVGDRWTLLIVRELLPGAMRYSALKASLVGIATNLLAERLRAMEANGVIERRLVDGGVAYALTAWGAELREPMEALGRWGIPLLATGRGEDAFRPRWLTLALPALLRGASASPPVELGLAVEGFLMVVRIDEDGPHAFVPTGEPPTTVFTADAEVVVGLAVGAVSVERALAAGRLKGDPRVLEAVFAPDRTGSEVSAPPTSPPAS